MVVILCGETTMKVFVEGSWSPGPFAAWSRHFFFSWGSSPPDEHVQGPLGQSRRSGQGLWPSRHRAGFASHGGQHGDGQHSPALPFPRGRCVQPGREPSKAQRPPNGPDPASWGPVLTPGLHSLRTVGLCPQLSNEKGVVPGSQRCWFWLGKGGGGLQDGVTVLYHMELSWRPLCQLLHGSRWTCALNLLQESTVQEGRLHVFLCFAPMDPFSWDPHPTDWPLLHYALLGE